MSGPLGPLAPPDGVLLLRCVRRCGVLEEAGYIVRRPDPDDRRSSLVALTDTRRTVVDDAVIDHIANENRLLAALIANEIRPAIHRLPRARKRAAMWADEVPDEDVPVKHLSASADVPRLGDRRGCGRRERAPGPTANGRAPLPRNRTAPDVVLYRRRAGGTRTLR